MRLALILAALGIGAAAAQATPNNMRGGPSQLAPKSRLPSLTVSPEAQIGKGKHRIGRNTVKRMAAKRRNVLRHQRACRG